MRTTAVAAVVVIAVVAAGVLLGWGLGLVELPGEDRHGAAVVTLLDANGTTLATVDARVADSRKERIRGLSDTASLSAGEGMLFVHRGVGERTYVMREMAFPLDIVFVVPCDEDCPTGADGRVTVVRAASVSPPGTDRLERYRGRAKWVLEVPRGYTADHGIGAGDYVRVEFGNATGERTDTPSSSDRGARATSSDGSAATGRDGPAARTDGDSRTRAASGRSSRPAGG